MNILENIFMRKALDLLQEASCTQLYDTDATEQTVRDVAAMTANYPRLVHVNPGVKFDEEDLPHANDPRAPHYPRELIDR